MRKLLKRRNGFDYNKQPKPNIEMAALALENIMLRTQLAIALSVPKQTGVFKSGGVTTVGERGRELVIDNTNAIKVNVPDRDGNVFLPCSIDFSRANLRPVDKMPGWFYDPRFCVHEYTTMSIEGRSGSDYAICTKCGYRP